VTLKQVQQVVRIGGNSLIALGANLPSDAGPPAATLLAAVEALIGVDIRLVVLSRLFATPCLPAGAGPDFVNAAAVLDTALPPQALLQRLHAVEARFGRRRDERWAARTLDLDLIAQGDAVLPDAATWAEWAGLPALDRMARAPDRLILPHPRLAERAFVLVPLAEVAPDWRHPVTGRSVLQMRDALPAAELAAVRPLGDGQGASPRL